VPVLVSVRPRITRRPTPLGLSVTTCSVSAVQVGAASGPKANSFCLTPPCVPPIATRAAARAWPLAAISGSLLTGFGAFSLYWATSVGVQAGSDASVWLKHTATRKVQAPSAVRSASQAKSPSVHT